MTNEAIAVILDYLSTEARNSMHTILGFMDLANDSRLNQAQRAAATTGRSSADRLLRSIDDVRELVSQLPSPPALSEELDLTLLAGEIADLMNLASGRRRNRITLDPPKDPILIAQDRRVLEQVLTRVFGAALKLSRGNEVRVKVAKQGNNRVMLTIHTRDLQVSGRLVKWLTTTLETVTLHEPDDVPFGVAVMVAGKRLSILGGSAYEVRDAAGHPSVVIEVPYYPCGTVRKRHPRHAEEMSDALRVLVAEDCDESYFLTELMLADEQVLRAHDGSEALRFIQKQRFDMVLMDVHMPGMDGYTAIRSIRDWETQTGNARTPVVVLSSDDLETQKRVAAESGCSGFLRKPVRRGDLQDLIVRLKQSRRLIA